MEWGLANFFLISRFCHDVTDYNLDLNYSEYSGASQLGRSLSVHASFSRVSTFSL